MRAVCAIDGGVAKAPSPLARHHRHGARCCGTCRLRLLCGAEVSEGERCICEEDRQPVFERLHDASVEEELEQVDVRRRYALHAVPCCCQLERIKRGMIGVHIEHTYTKVHKQSEDDAKRRGVGAL